mgnify:FL=1
MIFLIVGSQKFPFERLIREVDRLKKEGVIQERVVAQIGVSPYIPEALEWVRFLNKSDFDRTIEMCDLLITHAGEGAIMTGLLNGKKVIAVPRYQRFGEHVSDHQLEIARALEKQKCIMNVEDIADLEGVLRSVDSVALNPYPSGQGHMIQTICNFLG